MSEYFYIQHFIKGITRGKQIFNRTIFSVMEQPDESIRLQVQSIIVINTLSIKIMSVRYSKYVKVT
jgi:hypothetical protein